MMHILVIGFLLLFSNVSGKDTIVKEGSSLLYYQTSPVIETPVSFVSSSMQPIESMIYLRDTCFIAALDRYEYHYCPFRNITQRRIMGNTVSFIGSFYRYQDPVLLDEIAPLYRYSSVEYRGNKCVQDENVDLKTIVNYVCNEDDRKSANSSFDYGSFGIVAVDESVQCKYTFTFNVPLPCAVFTTDYKLELSEEDDSIKTDEILVKNDETVEPVAVPVDVGSGVDSVTMTVSSTVVNTTHQHDIAIKAVTTGVELSDKVDVLEQKIDHLLQLVTTLTEKESKIRRWIIKVARSIQWSIMKALKYFF